ncbi:MAG: hypothetical protein WD648_16390 [Planctomycetaceae bacterium]
MSGVVANARPQPGELRLLRSVICPNCWNRFPPEQVLWISQHEDLLGDHRLGESENQRFLPTRFTTDGSALDARGFSCRDLACPICHLPIARDLLEFPTFFVSTFGSHSCGKSFFVSAMSHMLRQVLPLHFRITIQDTDPKNNQRLKRFETAVFDNARPQVPVSLGKLIEKTQERGGDLYHRVKFGNQVVDFPIPFLFTLQPSSQHHADGTADGMGRVVCLYDNAGESFQPGADAVDSPTTRHLGCSNLLLFLFDPTQDSRFLKLLRSVDPTRIPKNPVRREQEPILQEAARRVKQFGGLGPREKHRVPLLVVVTKFDCWSRLITGRSDKEPWRTVRFPNNGAASAQPVSALECTTIQETSNQLREVLLRTCPEIVTAAEGFVEDVTYLPASSVGWSATPVDGTDTEPGNYRIRPEDARPYWVTVPLIYGLLRSIPGLIPKVW